MLFEGCYVYRGSNTPWTENITRQYSVWSEGVYLDQTCINSYFHILRNSL